MNKKKIMKNESVTRKTFAHSLGEVSISITLRTDIKQELKDGKEILQEIIKEIDQEIK